jgi:hypothetical protein
MLDGGSVLENILVLRKGFAKLPGVVAETLYEQPRAVGKGIYFRTIASGEDHNGISAVLLVVVNQMAGLGFVKRKLLPNIYRGSVVIQAYHVKVSGRAYLVLFHNAGAKISRYGGRKYPGKPKKYPDKLRRLI